MLNKALIGSIIFFTFGTGLCIGFLGGVDWDAYTRRMVEVQNACAHYDNRTGEFTWGPVPVTIEMPNALDAPPINDKPLLPKHKPRIKGATTKDYFAPTE